MRAEYTDPPQTFPGAGWYPPEISAVASISTLPPPDDEAECEEIARQEAARKQRGIGFAPPTQEER